MINTVIATKKQMSQAFLKNGKRIPITILEGFESLITQVKTSEKDGYSAIQLGVGEKKQKYVNKPLKGHLNKSVKKTDVLPKIIREVRIDDPGKYELGNTIQINEVLKEGDIISVAGVSKGKGFTGVMKRWGFKGGQRTHGQSDRNRAPGSIGQGTDPGRVHKGKKMAGRSGGDMVTVKNLMVVKVKDNRDIWIKGLVPGVRGSALVVEKVGEKKNFQGLFETSIVDKQQKTQTDESINDQKVEKKETLQEEKNQKNNEVKKTEEPKKVEDSK